MTYMLGDFKVERGGLSRHEVCGVARAARLLAAPVTLCQDTAFRGRLSLDRVAIALRTAPQRGTSIWPVPDPRPGSAAGTVKDARPQSREAAQLAGNFRESNVFSWETSIHA